VPIKKKFQSHHFNFYFVLLEICSNQTISCLLLFPLPRRNTHHLMNPIPAAVPAPAPIAAAQPLFAIVYDLHKPSSTRATCKLFSIYHRNRTIFIFYYKLICAYNLSAISYAACGCVGVWVWGVGVGCGCGVCGCVGVWVWGV
jgi:hypothetical protein